MSISPRPNHSSAFKAKVPLADVQNVFVERCWRSVKFEEVYLRPALRGGPGNLNSPLSG